MTLEPVGLPAFAPRLMRVKSRRDGFCYVTALIPPGMGRRRGGNGHETLRFRQFV